MHRFADAFEEHAILKGGMALRLLDSPRSTTAIDYVFVPFASKKQLLPRFRQLLDELGDAARVCARARPNLPNRSNNESGRSICSQVRGLEREAPVARPVDCYFLAGRLRQNPDLATLSSRLGSVRPRLPEMRKVRSMSTAELSASLREMLDNLTDESLVEELAATLPAEELAGLAPRMRASLTAVCERLETANSNS